MGTLNLDVLSRSLLAFFIGRDETKPVDWTPVITQAVNVTYTLIVARYVTIPPKLVFLEVRLDITGAGTGGQGIVISGLPTAIQPAFGGFNHIGGVIISDASGGPLRYEGAVIAFGADDLRFQADNAGGVMGGGCLTLRWPAGM